MHAGKIGLVRRLLDTGRFGEIHAMAKEKDRMRGVIDAFNEANGGGVIIRQDSRGYSLFREDNGRPVARLRPIGDGDKVEVMWWGHRDTWQQIGDFGPMIMPLRKALEYVVKDPMGFFWH